jgi:TRAP-type mannitol/chloroaromatic compound transport system permease large subunit
MDFKPLKKALAITAVLVFISAACICFGIAKAYRGGAVGTGGAMIAVGVIFAVIWLAYLTHVVKSRGKNK